ncbi:hypothetical protein CEUSTIGMA_g4073.t1 [Chlamydomonas eustigma]|uniref:Uncharacterized protein n=1 Tax=Chlamydomonas eustigma TaxID=1157962 RepID=A0A250X0M8_9CHLO|nr:hypothetical protein CEUSTIGMA_g4073.t1 [Chlamydomonas eustigma]|eukprot:GAX76627.1 hypothetical protein CEUSTIGMA_g4073.t1 [Chlamydomonas eustigma]
MATCAGVMIGQSLCHPYLGVSCFGGATTASIRRSKRKPNGSDSGSSDDEDFSGGSGDGNGGSGAGGSGRWWSSWGSGFPGDDAQPFHPLQPFFYQIERALYDLGWVWLLISALSILQALLFVLNLLSSKRLASVSPSHL